MRKSLLRVLLSVAVALPAVALPAAAQDEAPQGDHAAVVAAKGKMLVAVNGARLGQVYRVTPDGSVQVIVDGRMTTIPGSTLSIANGELTTSMSKSDVISHH